MAIISFHYSLSAALFASLVAKGNKWRILPISPQFIGWIVQQKHQWSQLFALKQFVLSIYQQ